MSSRDAAVSIFFLTRILADGRCYQSETAIRLSILVTSGMKGGRTPRNRGNILSPRDPFSERPSEKQRGVRNTPRSSARSQLDGVAARASGDDSPESYFRRGLAT